MKGPRLRLTSCLSLLYLDYSHLIFLFKSDPFVQVLKGQLSLSTVVSTFNETQLKIFSHTTCYRNMNKIQIQSFKQVDCHVLYLHFYLL